MDKTLSWDIELKAEMPEVTLSLDEYYKLLADKEAARRVIVIALLKLGGSLIMTHEELRVIDFESFYFTEHNDLEKLANTLELKRKK